MKFFKSVFVAAFFAVSLIPLLAMPFYKSASTSENRTLRKMPRAVEDGKINAGFFTQLNDYFSDNFAGRLDMVQLNAQLFTSTLRYSANEKVIYGKSGWLYFHETIDDYIGRTKFSDADIQRLVTVLSLEQEYLATQGIPYFFTVAPNKNTIYPENMPCRYMRTQSPTVLERMTDAIKESGVRYADLSAAIRGEKENGSLLYHKTDTHWNDLGARLAVNRLMSDVKAVVPDFFYDDFSHAKVVQTTAAGDLKKMLFPLAKAADEGRTSLDFEKEYEVQRPFRSVEDARITTTSAGNQYRLMMFRDSFGNAIIPFISNNFGYAYYSKDYPVNFSEIEKHDPDVVIYEIAQRNIPRIVKKAPVMPALERQVEFLNPKEADGGLFTEKRGNLIQLYGYLDGVSDVAYRCYLTDSAGRTYEAFPILESEKLSEKAEFPDTAAGFSMYLKAEDMISGAVTVTIDFMGSLESHVFTNIGG